MVFSSNLALIFFITSAFCEQQNSVEEQNTTGQQPSALTKYWLPIVGDVCQLPSFVHTAGDPKRYIECVRQIDTIDDRDDIGIWVLRECPPEQIFVAVARRCMTLQTVIQRVSYCDGPDANTFLFCLQDDKQGPHFVINAIQQCACPIDEENCACPTPGIFEKVQMNNSSAYSSTGWNLAVVNTIDMHCVPPAEPARQTPLEQQSVSQQIRQIRQASQQQAPLQQQMPSTQQVPMQQIIGGPQVIQPQMPNSPPQQPMQQPQIVQQRIVQPNVSPQFQSQQVAPQPQQLSLQPTNAQQFQSASQQPVPIQEQQQWNNVNGAPSVTITSPQVQQFQSLGGQQQQQQTIVPSIQCSCPETACICIQVQPICQFTTTQQQYCPKPGDANAVVQPPVQPQRCSLAQGQSSQIAEYQGICSWMVDPLAVDPQGSTTYLQCQPTTNNLYCGRWQRMPCSPGTTFNVNMQLCTWDSAQGQSSQIAEYQGICSWMVDPLAVDPQGSTTYLQCQPTTNNLYCGRWQRMPCSPGTTFNVNMQLCTWDSGAQPGQFPTAQPPYATASTPGANGGQCTCSSGIPISSCYPKYLCPGQSNCQTTCSVCCYFPGRL
ncbi:hypothetical protein Tcan_12308 [Toxocara canis]|uniref:Chitin-binding type-2 domain-containing protein n=1 Tax=Toxocara canis TaxID=6265 RepID=A0A0B2VEX8_TOXCA|nr:hypothetical protein Tcan_12308 [Toxocara canis]